MTGLGYLYRKEKINCKERKGAVVGTKQKVIGYRSTVIVGTEIGCLVEQYSNRQ
jgi:hypothetical protein